MSQINNTTFTDIAEVAGDTRNLSNVVPWKGHRPDCSLAHVDYIIASYACAFETRAPLAALDTTMIEWNSND